MTPIENSSNKMIALVLLSQLLSFYLFSAPGGIRTRNGLSPTLLIKSQKRYHLRHESVPSVRTEIQTLIKALGRPRPFI